MGCHPRSRWCKTCTASGPSGRPVAALHGRWLGKGHLNATLWAAERHPADTVIERGSFRKPPYWRGMPGTDEDHLSLGSTTSAYKDLRIEGSVSLEVEDRGKGIPPEKREVMESGGTLGVGIRGMRERLRQLGGSLEINSNGT